MKDILGRVQPARQQPTCSLCDISCQLCLGFIIETTQRNFSPEELTVVIFYIPSLSNLILKLLLNISTISEVQFSVFIWILVGLQLSIVSTVD